MRFGLDDVLGLIALIVIMLAFLVWTGEDLYTAIEHEAEMNQ